MRREQKHRRRQRWQQIRLSYIQRVFLLGCVTAVCSLRLHDKNISMCFLELQWVNSLSRCNRSRSGKQCSRHKMENLLKGSSADVDELEVRGKDTGLYNCVSGHWRLVLKNIMVYVTVPLLTYCTWGDVCGTFFHFLLLQILTPVSEPQCVVLTKFNSTGSQMEKWTL